MPRPASSGKKNKFGHLLIVVQLIHRLVQADISSTTTACLFIFPLLVDLHQDADLLALDDGRPDVVIDLSGHVEVGRDVLVDRLPRRTRPLLQGKNTRYYKLKTL